MCVHYQSIPGLLK